MLYTRKGWQPMWVLHQQYYTSDPDNASRPQPAGTVWASKTSRAQSQICHLDAQVLDAVDGATLSSTTVSGTAGSDQLHILPSTSSKRLAVAGYSTGWVISVHSISWIREQ